MLLLLDFVNRRGQKLRFCLHLLPRRCFIDLLLHHLQQLLPLLHLPAADVHTLLELRVIVFAHFLQPDPHERPRDLAIDKRLGVHLRMVDLLYHLVAPSHVMREVLKLLFHLLQLLRRQHY